MTTRAPGRRPQPPAPEEPHLHPTSWRTVLAALLIGLVVGFVVVSALDVTGVAVPITPWSLPGMLGTLAIVAYFYGRDLARRLRERRGSISPEEGVRALVFGKVMVLGGALLVGWHVGYVARYLGRVAVPAPQQRVVHGTVTVALSAVFALVGWLLERACIVPHDDDESDDES